MQWAEGVATPAHGTTQASPGHGTASFKLVPWTSLPTNWKRPGNARQHHEAVVAYECVAEQLVAETMVELPDEPWGMAYFQWAKARLDALPADQRSTFLQPMLVPSAEFSDGRASAQSLLIRQCECHATQDQRLCPVHCMDWSIFETGDRIFDIKEETAKSKLRRYCSMLSFPGAHAVSLKVFRASKATNLALAGKPLHEVLQSGEWRSAAVLRYARPEALDLGSMVTAEVMKEQETDDEADYSPEEPA